MLGSDKFVAPHFYEKMNAGKRVTGMIDVTKLNGKEITVNCELIEFVEETPDTVITLTTNKKIIVKESRQMVKNLVKLYKRECYSMKNIE